MSDKLAFTIPEVAASLGISVWLVKKEIYGGRLASVKIGRRTVIPRWVLEEWLKPSVSEPEPGIRA